MELFRIFCFFSIWCLVLRVNGHNFPYFYTPPNPPAFRDLQQIDSPFGHLQPVPSPFLYQGLQLPSIYQSPEPSLQVPASFHQLQDPLPSFPDNYRGFGYHTNYDDGASATVVFFSGGSLQNITFSNRVTIASDNLDPQQTENAQERIEKALKEGRNAIPFSPEQNSFFSLAPLVQSLLQNPFQQPGIINFYQAEGFPANTRPLIQPVPSWQDQIIQVDNSTVPQSMTLINDNLENDTLTIDAASDNLLSKSSIENHTSSQQSESTTVEAFTSYFNLTSESSAESVTTNDNTTANTTSESTGIVTTNLSMNETNSTEVPATTRDVLTLEQTSTLLTNGSTTEQNYNVSSSF